MPLICTSLIELLFTAIWGKCLRFGLHDLKSLAIRNERFFGVGEHGVYLEKGSFQKGRFLRDSREFLEILEIPQTMENRRIRPSSRDSILEILEILEILQ